MVMMRLFDGTRRLLVGAHIDDNRCRLCWQLVVVPFVREAIKREYERPLVDVALVQKQTAAFNRPPHPMLGQIFLVRELGARRLVNAADNYRFDAGRMLKRVFLFGREKHFF